MHVIKSLLWEFVKVFFRLYFKLFGKPALSKEMKKTISLYDNDNFNKLFSLVRTWDAPFEELNKIVPKKSRIIDLGCGDGILTNFLAVSSKDRIIQGIEINEIRINRADKKLPNTKYISGDVTKVKLSKADVIIIVHVLHHLKSKEDQIQLIKFVKSKLNRNGRLIIVEIAEKPALKYILTWLTDAFIVPILFEGKLFDFNFHYRKVNEWEKIFVENNMSYKTMIVHKGKPFPHVIFECTNMRKNGK